MSKVTIGTTPNRDAIELGELLSMLEGVKDNGRGQYVALCPSHDDHRQSLSVAQGDDGVLMYCHAGCDFSEIIEALSLSPRRFFKDNGKGSSGIVSTYDYTDESGDLLFQVVRKRPKAFLQRRPDGRGGWTWSVEGVDKVLYHLPDVLEAETVFVVEGEKSADKLASLGVTSTTNPGGSNKWRYVDQEPLRGKRVVVIPDNDVAGFKHANEVAKALDGVASEIKIVELPDVRLGKSDPYDWVQSGGTLEQLMELVEATEAEGEQIDLLSTGIADEGNAQAVKLLHGDEFLLVDGLGWVRWTGTHWTAREAEPVLERAIVDTLKKRRVQAVLAEADSIVSDAKPSSYKVNAAKKMLGSLLHDHIDSFDSDPDRINVRNGVLDLMTGKLESHSPEHRFTYCLPVEYDPEADAALWMDCLEKWIPDEGTRSFLQRAVGYSLSGRTREEVLFYLYGPPRAGKGTFTETLIYMMGQAPLATEIDFDVFAKSFNASGTTYEIAGLKACRIVVAGESGEGQYLNAERVKRLTGGNFITAQHKYQDPFTFRPQFKVWLATNPEPAADANDEALWARMQVVHFPNSWLGREDKTLKSRLRSEESIKGVLAWAVEGAMDWYRNGLNPPETVTEETHRVREDQDWVKMFVDREIVRTEDPADRVSNSTIYLRYEEWSKNAGAPTLGRRRLGWNLSRLGIEPYKSDSHRGREGIKMRQRVAVSGSKVTINP